METILPIYSGLVDHDALLNYVAAKHKTIAESRTDTGEIILETRNGTDPGTPDAGRIWVRTDL